MVKLREKSLNPSIGVEKNVTELLFEEVDERVKLALRCATEKKATDPILLNLRGIADFTDFFIITSGTNQRQVQAIADEIEEKMKKEYDESPISFEGYQSAEWILMDYGDFIVHIFDQEAREFYDLERLWRDAQKVNLPESF